MATVAAAKMARTNTDVAPHVHMSNPPAMPQLTTAMFDEFEHKNLPTEPSHTSMTKTRPNYSSPTVGKYYYLCEKKVYEFFNRQPLGFQFDIFPICLYFTGKNQLILVSCERKQQVYCQLCSVRLKHSSHTSSDEHKFNYEVCA